MVYGLSSSLNIRRGAWLACAAALILSLTGLGLASMHKPAQHSAAIIVAATATANEPAPALGTPEVNRLQSAGAHGTTSSAWVVNPANQQATRLLLTPVRANGQVEHGPRRSQMLTANVSRIQTLLQASAANGQPDLLAPMTTASHITSAPATLILISSGLTTTGAFDLRQVGWDASPSRLATELNNRGLLPRLPGWTLIFVGLGDTAGRQPSLPLPDQTILIQYWKAICHETGASKCIVDQSPRPERPSLSKAPVPLVPISQVVSVRGPDHSSITEIPAEELFAFNSPSLGPTADNILGPIAREAHKWHLNVTITGYASPDGGTQKYNNALSITRALSVRDRLIALGLAASQIMPVQGLGTANHTARECYLNGHLDERRCAHLRRVAIKLSPASSPST